MRVLWIFVVLLGAQSAGALELLRSDPAAGAVLDESPKDVRLWFAQTPELPATIRLVGKSVTIDAQYVHTMGENDLMGMVLEALPDGDYQMQYQSGQAQGSVPFSVRRDSQQAADVWEPPLDIGVVLYDGAEPLDVFGPVEMWMNAADLIRVHMISETGEPVALTTTGYPKDLAPRLQAQYSFANAPDLDVLMVPGGVGTLVEVDNPAMIGFVQAAVADVAVATSVCTGSAIYAKAGLLEGVAATGNKMFFDYLVSQGPADWQPEARWVESGRFFTSSGVSAGIDMSLAVIARFFGVSSARMIATSTEYEWNEDPTRDPFVKHLNNAVPHVEALRSRFAAE